MSRNFLQEIIRVACLLVIIIVVLVGAFQCTAQNQAHQLACLDKVGQKNCLTQPYSQLR